ncbi:hypothetical protein BDD43_1264 [Mucilaginibacter gracilis]|uniref:Uncharacterized protein n=1 Tax=Mucilaginibacter gracilis TaxID=423350 RepID=A0A495IWR9_9SPHI|nr:hypothetical protein [Mucilaginibacter gracilis]RKR81120.1 hypothetical protein BDD43_1264 [Mucilaginibacter gracilis]
MKRICLNTLLFIITVLCFTSCNPKYRFVTHGLREVDSSYVITKKGERINAASVIVKRRTLTVDGKEMSLQGLSAIKSKKMYFVINDDELYFGEIYGKINMIYKIVYGYSYNGGAAYGTGGVAGSGYGGVSGNGYQRNATRVYYLQKQGSADIDKLNKGVLLDYLSDNDEALHKARGAYAWRYASYGAAAAFATGVVLTGVNLINSKDGSSHPIGTPLAIAGAALPVYFVTSGIADHKIKKAIYIYNGIQ